MLWDPGAVKKDGDEDEPDKVPVTPILVPMQNMPTVADKSVPVLVPDVQELKDQFQQQQNMLTQIKETLKQNESQLSSKGKQVEVYANKLSQIRARSKNTQGKKSSLPANPSTPKTITKKSSRENLNKEEKQVNDDKTTDNISKFERKGKVSELKKCLEENKIKFELRTGKEQSETKKIESLVEQLKTQLEERDKTIQDLQKNIEQSTPKPALSLPKKSKNKSDKESVASQTTQTNRIQPSDDSIEIIALQNRIYELEASVLDLQENLKEKESVIEARTQAVTLLSQDLSLKGKNTLESLEETRQEMRTMQNNFIAIEDQLKKDLIDRDNRLATLEEKCSKLESTNFELSLKNAEQQEKLVNLQSKYVEAEKERKSLKELGVQGQTNDKLEELTKKITVLTKELDDRNKSMIKMKIEHKNKIKSLNKTIETLKGASDDKAEILRLNNLLAEFENVKIGLENRVAELEDEKVSEKKLKDQINELEIIIQKQNEDIALHLKTICNLEKEKSDLMQSNKDKNVLIENLQSKIVKMESETKQDTSEVGDSKLAELSRKMENMEAEYTRKLEDLRAEHCKEIEMLEAYYNSKTESVDRRELEEYRISTEISNIHVEEQIELLIREKQQLLEKLKSLSGVSSTDSLTFEKMEHSDLRDDKETTQQLGEDDLNQEEKDNKISHLERIVNDQQILISDLQKTINEEQQKTTNYQQKIRELEGTIKHLEEVNNTLKQQSEMVETAEPSRNQKSNTNAKNRIKKIESELSQGRKIIEEQKEKLKELNLKLEEKEELIKKYTEKIELFEKDDWDRQNHWKNVEGDIETVQELQKKCLSLENNLLELNEDCERLRKENIEVVHLLSEEKVKRRKLLEQIQSESDSDRAEKRINDLHEVLKTLEEKVEKLEQNHTPGEISNENLEEDLQSKLEWANVVLTGKETEIFRLQNLLEDSNKTIEILQADLTDSKSKLTEKEMKLNKLTEQLKAKEVQLEEISTNFDKLQQCVDVANHKTATNESQLQELLATVKEMEGDVFRKESELQEIKGILAEKNLDMSILRNRLEEVNSDLTYSYQEHLENMGKCLRDKESDYDALFAEKNDLEEMNKRLVAEKEDIYNQKVEINNEIEKLRNVILEKEKLITDLTEKLNAVENTTTSDIKGQNIEDMKIKMKKLAANLKKRAQNEADLTKQLKQMEEAMLEKEKTFEKQSQELADVTEKWTVEKSEKEQIRNDLSQVLTDKVALEDEKASLKEKIQNLEAKIESFKSSNDIQIQKMEAEIQRLNETSVKLQMIEKEDKGKIAHLESKVSEILGLYEQSRGNQQEVEEERKTKETILQKLAEITGKYEEIKFKHDQLLLEKSDLENKIEEQFKFSSDKSILEAKIQENMAVIENLETELKKTQDQMKIVQEKYCYSEERRSSLENKNEEMCKKIMEDSETLVTIDDLSTRVEELLKSEKHLQNSVKNLTTSNTELKQMLDGLQSEKYNLEAELKASTDKIAELSEEIKHLKDADSEKSVSVKELKKELEKLKADKKQISSEYEKLNKDYEQFENDYKESLENSQNIEKSLKRKIEELVSENSILQEKLSLSEEKSQAKSEEDKKPKKRKSVTFRTDEAEYIKDLKAQLHKYDANLKAANEELEKVKAELLREKLRKEVENVVAEAAEKVESLKSTPEKEISIEFPKPIVEPEIIQSKFITVEKSPEEKKFDANVFFGSETGVSFFDKTKTEEQVPETDSLMWDDGWGTDGQLEEEYLSAKDATSKVKVDSNRMQELESEVKKLEVDNENLKKDIQESTIKYAKVVKKLKELKAQNDKLQAELSKSKISSGFEDLDAAIVDELKSQIEDKETKEKELLKTLENLKMEKDSLLKKIDVLNAGNEKFLEMKERQDNDIEIWQRKNNELLKEISELRQQLNDPLIQDDNVLMKENRELKNQKEALEWENCELKELLEEKQEILEKSTKNFEAGMEKVTQEKSTLQKEIDELNNVKALLEKKLLDEENKSFKAVGELQEQITALGSENETLQDILGKMKDSSTKQDQAGSRIVDYFKSSKDVDIFPVSKVETPRETEKLKQRITELEEELKVKNEEFKKKSEELNQRIIELENMSAAKEQEIQKANEYFQQKLKELEGGLILRDEELHQLRNQNLEKENELSNVRQNVFELESLLMLKDQELTPKRKQNVEELSQTQSFETVDLNQSVESSVPSENVENLRQRIFEMENLLGFKEEELQQILQVKENEVDNLRQKINHLEETMKIKEGSNQFVWNQTSGNTMEETNAQENEKECLRQRICQLEDSLRAKHDELLQFQAANQPQLFGGEGNALQEKIFQLEEMVRIKDEELMRLQSVNWDQLNQQNLQFGGNEVENLRQKIFSLEEQLRLKEEELNQLQLVHWNQGGGIKSEGSQTEKNVNENLRQKIFQLEDVLRLRERELSSLQAANWSQGSAKELVIVPAEENEIKSLRQKIIDLEETLRLKNEELNRFNFVPLNQSIGSEQANENEVLRQKILQLEEVVKIREEELMRFQTANWDQSTGKMGDEFQNNMNDSEILRQRVFQLEELLRVRENELGQLQAANWGQDGGKELEVLRQKVRELEEFIKYNENELYQMQSLKDNEIQNLEQKIYQLENISEQGQGLQQKIMELENMAKFKEEESGRILNEKAAETEIVRQRIMELETLVSSKDEEISQLTLRLSELEKSYNDSKLEIERLLNEEKLNSEEKFVEPFQKNIQFPVAFELEALSRTLNEEKQKLENLKYELVEKDNLLQAKSEEIQILNAKIQFMDDKGKETEDSKQVTIQLEKIISDLQQELENTNLQLSVAKTELEEFQSMKDEVMGGLKSQLVEMEKQLLESKEKNESEVAQLRAELSEKTQLHDIQMEAKKNEDSKTSERIKELEKSNRELEKVKQKLEKEVEMLKSELESKENDIESLAQMLEEERNQVAQITELLESKENEVADLRQTLTHLQGEITQFRNFEKQIKELRAAQIKEGGGEVQVTAEGHPDLSDWSEHELAELSTRLQSDLDTALYMLHQRDVRCDELTFELMQLLEERDTLQLRLSTALRINEELRALNKLEKTGSSENLQENKDLLDQSNDRQSESGPEPSEDLRLLANKISELHSVSYLRDKTVKDDSVQRHKEQMNLLSRISDSDMSLTRDVQSSPAVLLNWVRGKTTPKVMHL